MGLIDNIKKYAKVAKNPDSQNLIPKSQLSNFTIIDATKAQEMPQLAPSEVNGYRLTYHYQDVRINVPWRLSGHYGKSVKSIGVKRGDILSIAFDPHTINEEYDKDNIALVWKGVRLGDMNSNRLRDMVRKWTHAGLPIYCGVTLPADDRHFFIEFGFYGKP